MKTEITLPSGTKVRLEGAPHEVEDVVRRLTGPVLAPPGSTKTDGDSRRPGTAGTVSGYILELERDGYFDQARGLSEVKAALASEGHVVPITTLSGRMLSLVKQKRLRRLRSEGVWKYVDR